MRWGIRNQILLPVAALLLAAVALTAFSAAYLAAERSEREIADRLSRVKNTLGNSDFPYSQNVVEMMKGLAGAEFVVLDDTGKIAATTILDLDAKSLIAVDVEPESETDLADQPLLTLKNEQFFAAGYRRINPRGRRETLYVLYPELALRTARREAAMPPLMIGCVTLAALVVLSVWLAARFGRRIRRVQEQVARMAEGDFREMPLGKTRDEIFELVGSINQMAGKLSDFEDAIGRTERSRLLGQLAGGLAHQLRNAVTGARLAIQLHQRRCANQSDAESLEVALRQLTLTEEHIRSLLAVGKPELRDAVAAGIDDVLTDVAALVSPVCRHECIRFTLQANEIEGTTTKDGASLRTAVLNLVLNAVDATGPEGEVSVFAHRNGDAAVVEVTDNGPGPPAEICDRLFDPFITGKPEGVGLGLALVRQAADELNGSIEWERVDHRTQFRLTLPIASASISREREAAENSTIADEPEPRVLTGASRQMTDIAER